MISTSKPTGTAHLEWTADIGFRLDFTGVSDELTVAIGSIPIPADGTIELCAEPLELDKLDLLFKAEVDVGGLPGQVHEGQIAFSATSAKLTCVVEEVESGELIDFECETPFAIPKEAPKAGGPRPIPSDDAELDWEDDDTLEAMLGDRSLGEEIVAEPLTERASSPSQSKGADKGLDALLKALLQVGEGDEPDASAAVSLEDLGKDLLLSEPEPIEEEPEDEDGPALDPANARGLLSLLINGEDLELEEGYSVDDLVAGAAPIVAGMKPSGQKATALSEWLFQQDSVAELYMDDESLASLLEQW